MNRTGFHLRAMLTLAILLIGGWGRGADSEIRLITAAEDIANEANRLAAEGLADEIVEERPELLNPPSVLQLDPSDLPHDANESLSPDLAPLEDQDGELCFETAGPTKGRPISGGLCARLRQRFAWLHGPPLPIVSERWNERTLYVGIFVGGFWGDDLVVGRVRQGAGVNGGIRLGWDFDDYWGLEGRIAMAGASVRNLNAPFNDRTGVQKFFDAELMFYPWTTNRFRPFLLAGIGVGVIDFDNDVGIHIVNSTPIFPLGFGFKYRHDDWVAFRLDFIDTIALGVDGQFANTSNFSLNCGVEFRLGGPRKTYWPWSRRWLY